LKPTLRCDHVVRCREVIGSVARGGDRFADVDFLVGVGGQPVVAAFKRYMELKANLEALLGRPVDLVEPSAIANPYFRKAIDRDRSSS
jgi:predicted nucleotidyltransferase